MNVFTLTSPIRRLCQINALAAICFRVIIMARKQTAAGISYFRFETLFIYRDQVNNNLLLHAM